MSDAIYELRIRARAGEEIHVDPSELGGHLGRIPGVERATETEFRFGEADEHGQMVLRCAEEEDAVEIEIPRPWVLERGPQVFALVFMTAEWCGGEVFDPQIDDTLRKDAVLQGLVAMRQAQREHEGASPAGPPAPSGEASTERPARKPWYKP